MGGYGSGGHNRRRVTAAACVRIDAAMIRRAGLIDATKPTAWRWPFKSGGRPACEVDALARPGVSALDVLIRLPNGHTHTQAITLTWQPTPWGARRYLFKCPICGARAHRLYYYPRLFSGGRPLHMFLCRRCLGLTYDCQRTRDFDRCADRCEAEHARVKAWAHAHGAPIPDDGGEWGTPWEVPPERPRGMREATYARILARWARASMDARAAYGAKLMAMLGRVGAD